VSELAIGAAVADLRERQATADGRPALGELRRVVASHGPDELPHIRAMLADDRDEPADTFHEALVTVLHGVAARRGERWGRIAPKLDALAASAPRR
jgi:hypothetical protein